MESSILPNPSTCTRLDPPRTTNTQHTHTHTIHHKIRRSASIRTVIQMARLNYITTRTDIITSVADGENLTVIEIRYGCTILWVAE